MATSFKMKCPKCGAFLRINETGELAPGCRDRIVVCCPKCDHEVHSKLTSGDVWVAEITEKEFNEGSL